MTDAEHNDRSRGGRCEPGGQLHIWALTTRSMPATKRENVVRGEKLQRSEMVWVAEG